jgi:uncharacterized protein (TIGR01244 family)
VDSLNLFAPDEREQTSEHVECFPLMSYDRRMKIFYLVCAILVSISSAAAQEDSIKNFLRVNKEFCTGGQPSLEQLEKLKADGVKAVINLRQPAEYAAAEEEAKAKALGLRYFNIPVSPTDPKDEQATEFLKLTDDRENRPAFIHCRSAARVAAFWMIRRVLRDDWKLEDAVKEAEKVGLGDHPALSEFARKYIERHRQAGRTSNPLLVFGHRLRLKLHSKALVQGFLF